MLLVQPFGDGDAGHGEKLKLSDALSRDAFLVLDGALPVAALEMDAEVRYDDNPVLHGHTSGELGLPDEFHRRLWLGLIIGTDSVENDYLLTLRWNFK